MHNSFHLSIGFNFFPILLNILKPMRRNALALGLPTAGKKQNLLWEFHFISTQCGKNNVFLDRYNLYVVTHTYLQSLIDSIISLDLILNNGLGRDFQAATNPYQPNKQRPFVKTYLLTS